MNGVDVTRNIKKSQKQGSSTQRGILETIQSSYHSDMRATNLSKDIVPSVSLPFPSEKNDVKIIDNITLLCIILPLISVCQKHITGNKQFAWGVIER